MGPAGSADVWQMLDDLGSLSEQGLVESKGQERWKWLHPWAWVSGIPWRQGPSKSPMVDLTLQISGIGLENCRNVQVLTCALVAASCITVNLVPLNTSSVPVLANCTDLCLLKCRPGLD